MNSTKESKKRRPTKTNCSIKWKRLKKERDRRRSAGKDRISTMMLKYMQRLIK